MIVGKLCDLYRYKGIAKNIDTAIDYILTHDLLALPKGKTVVDGTNVYINRDTYIAKPLEECFFENHENYIDIQIVLKGKEIIGGRPGGIPEMALEYVLKQNGLNPENDVKMVTNVDFTATAGAFKSGIGDYVALFEPTATMLEKDGAGNIVSSIGNEAGNISYTCFYTTKSYMDENPEIIQKFTNAIYKGQQWVQQHTSEEVADSIISFFPGTDKEVIVKVIDNYKNIEAYSETPEVSEDGLNKLMDIIQGYDESLITERPDFNIIVNNSFAKQAIK